MTHDACTYAKIAGDAICNASYACSGAQIGGDASCTVMTGGEMKDQPCDAASVNGTVTCDGRYACQKLVATDAICSKKACWGVQYRKTCTGDGCVGPQGCSDKGDWSGKYCEDPGNQQRICWRKGESDTYCTTSDIHIKPQGEEWVLPNYGCDEGDCPVKSEAVDPCKPTKHFPDMTADYATMAADGFALHLDPDNCN